MSRKSRAIKNARTVGQIPTTKVKSPGDIVSIVPYLLGFDPVDSVVVVGLEGPRKRFGPCFRLDLATGDAEVGAQVDYIEELVRHLSLRRVLLVAYCAFAGRADPVMRGVCAMLREQRVEIQEALRADGRRWWSYTCDNPVCCTPDGTPYDLSTSRVAAEAVVAGMQRLPSRDALRAQFEPDPARQTAVAASLQVLPVRPLSDVAFDDLVHKGLSNPAGLNATEVASLVSGVQPLARRDGVWSSMERSTAARHFDLWSHLMGQAPDELVAPVGSLAAFAAWLNGTGVLASHATDRVLAVEPTYSMALLLEDILVSAVNPKHWDERVGSGREPGGQGHADGLPDLAG